MVIYFTLVNSTQMVKLTKMQLKLTQYDNGGYYQWAVTISEVAKHIHFTQRMWRSIKSASDKTLSGIVMGSEYKDK